VPNRESIQDVDIMKLISRFLADSSLGSGNLKIFAGTGNQGRREMTPYGVAYLNRPETALNDVTLEEHVIPHESEELSPSS
jgi:hypothetical protein